MLELVNLANDRETEKILQATPHLLEEILTTHKLDGLEMIFCEPWNLTRMAWEIRKQNLSKKTSSPPQIGSTIFLAPLQRASHRTDLACRHSLGA